MKSHNEILNEFGKLVIHDVFDKQYQFISNKIERLSETERFKNLFHSISEVQKTELENYTKEILNAAIFNFLKIFEENEHFKIIYDNEGEIVDLNNISEMLKAEPIIENGWLEKFSIQLKRNNQ